MHWFMDSRSWVHGGHGVHVFNCPEALADKEVSANPFCDRNTGSLPHLVQAALDTSWVPTRKN